jgi:hypothetical protein
MSAIFHSFFDGRCVNGDSHCRLETVLFEILAVQQPRAKSFRQVVPEIEFQKPGGDK